MSTHDHTDHAGHGGDSTWAPRSAPPCTAPPAVPFGEVLGMVLATWWGWSTWPSVILAVVLAFSLAVAFVVTVPVNRWMIGRGLGHAKVHEFHH